MGASTSSTQSGFHRIPSSYTGKVDQSSSSSAKAATTAATTATATTAAKAAKTIKATTATLREEQTDERFDDDEDHFSLLQASQRRREQQRKDEELHKEIEFLASCTCFDRAALNQLAILFDHISELDVNDGYIVVKEFAAALEMNPSSYLCRQIFSTFDKTKTARLNFRGFTIALSALSDEAPLAEKIRFSFDIYDKNKDGSIDLSELRELLIAALEEMNDAEQIATDSNNSPSSSFTDKQIDQICKHTLQSCDLDGNGVISFDEYTILVKQNPQIISPFNINIKTLIRKHSSRAQLRLILDQL